MSKTVIQIPIDSELLEALDEISIEQSKSRAEVIRTACRKYLRETAEERLDRFYQEGYQRIPENPVIAESQVKMLNKIWQKESW
jgi:metal-responsive CopG/Arc/MetJ family transcriptional regulator